MHLLMMTQLHFQTTWKVGFVTIVALAWLGLSMRVAWAETQINVICNDQDCNADTTPSEEVWAPGSVLQRKVQIENQSSRARTITAKVVINEGQESAAMFSATWRNGSRRLLWQGSLAQSVAQISLGQLTATASRTFWLDVSLPKAVDNTVQQKVINFEPIITLTEVSPAPAKVKTSKTTAKKASSMSSVLGQVVNRLSFTLPDLHRLTASAITPKTVTQFVQSARNQRGWEWLAVIMEIATLWLWHHDNRGWIWLGWVGGVAVIASWLVSSWWICGIGLILTGLAGVWKLWMTKRGVMVID